MKTKLNTISRQGEVKTVNAIAAIHKILDEISDNGKLSCQMHNAHLESSFVFISNGICATFHVQPVNQALEGGEL